MIIYLPNMKVVAFDKLCSSKATFLNSENETMFYSDYGIFILKNNTFYKQVIESKNNDLVKKSNTELLIDNSVISYKQVFSQIPADCVIKTIKRNKYQIDELMFVVVSHDDVLYDFYIDTHMNINNPNLEKGIGTFLFE